MAELLLPDEILSGLRKGLGFAVSVCAVFVAAYVIRGTAGIDPFQTLFSVVAACLISGAVGGLLFGLLHRWRSSVLGRAGVGAIVTFGVVFCLGMFSDATPDSWGRQDWKLIGMFSAAGAALGAASVLWRRKAR
jgi:hypothetical protein